MGIQVWALMCRVQPETGHLWRIFWLFKHNDSRQHTLVKANILNTNLIFPFYFFSARVPSLILINSAGLRMWRKLLCVTLPPVALRPCRRQYLQNQDTKTGSTSWQTLHTTDHCQRTEKYLHPCRFLVSWFLSQLDLKCTCKSASKIESEVLMCWVMCHWILNAMPGVNNL